MAALYSCRKVSTEGRTWKKVDIEIMHDRWGQASAQIEDLWLLSGGKTNQDGGGTYDSAPETSDLLALDLSITFQASDPPWQILLPASGPAVAFHTLTTLSDNQLLLFGGSATSLAVPSGNDSSYLVDFPTNALASGVSVSFAQYTSPQPMRRTYAATVAISTQSTATSYIIGGLKNDGSGTAFNEIYSLSIPTGSPASSGTFTALTPGPLVYGHTATVLQSEDGEPMIVVIGGVTPDQYGSASSMAAMDEIWTYSPSTDQWISFAASGEIPSTRRGHVAIALGSNHVLIHGGANQAASQVYQDLYSLQIDQDGAIWSLVEKETPVGARFGHSVTTIGDNALIAFGYGSNQAADTSLAIYNLLTHEWADTFSPAVIPAAPSQTQSPIITSVTDQAGSTVAGVVTTQTQVSDGITSIVTTVLPPAATVPTAAAQPTTQPQFSVPGQAPVTGSVISSTPTASSDTKAAPPQKTVIIGSVAGVLGALIAGGAVWYLRRRNSSKALYAAALRSQDGDDDGLMGEKGDKSWSGQVLAARQIGQSKQPKKWATFFNGAPSNRGARFDMLADEESDVWAERDSLDGDTLARRSSVSTWRSRGSRNVSTGWQDAPLADEVNEERRGLASEEAERALEESRRAGMGIWDDSRYPPERSKTRSSYMNTSLGSWLATDEEEPAHEARRMRTLSTRAEADPFEEPEAVFDLGDETAGDTTIEDTTSLADTSRLTEESYVTNQSTEQSVVSSLPTSASSHSGFSIKNPLPPPASFFSPSQSLYGSTFSSAVPATPETYSPLVRGGTWFSRSTTGTAPHRALSPIRDPTPVPSPPVKVETPTSEDPFIDQVDEAGRTDKRTAATRTGSQASKYSNLSVSTANSSQLEAKFANMQ